MINFIIFAICLMFTMIYYDRMTQTIFQMKYQMQFNILVSMNNSKMLFIIVNFLKNIYKDMRNIP